MRSQSLDRRVRKEATILVREARAALDLKRGLRGKAGDLEAATTEVEEGLSARDLTRVRKGLPVLDSLVDELIKRPGKSTTRDYVESIGAAVLIALALRAFVIEAFKIPSSSMYPTLEIGDHIFVNKFIYGVRIPWTNTKVFELRGPKRGEVIVFMQPCETDRDYIKRVVALPGDTVEVRCNVVYVNGVANENTMLRAEERYDDFDDGAGPEGKWYPKEVSRYREKAGDFEYQTFHDALRPQRDEQRAKGALLQGDAKDFPLDTLLRSCANSAELNGKPASNQKQGKIVSTRDIHGVCDPYLHYIVPENHVFVMGDNRANSNDSRYWGSVPIENIKGKALFIWLSYSHWTPFDWSGIRWDRVGNFVH
ncbi:MAG: signal peptidase I [Deltaproteobacteria bacterium]|nr:signal peptidase I [Deltaproteobacteria bacterium]